MLLLIKIDVIKSKCMADLSVSLFFFYGGLIVHFCLRTSHKVNVAWDAILALITANLIY